MTWSPSCCRCNKGGERGGRRGLATALPAALGLKLSHFAGSSTARTGGSKIGTARKIHLAEASVQQSGRGAARRRGRMERGRGCGEETLHSLHRPSHPWGQILSTPPPDVYITPTQPPLHTQAKALKSPQGHSGLMGWPGLLPKGSRRNLPSPFAPLPTAPSQLTSLASASWAVWHWGHLSTWGGQRHLCLPDGLPTPRVASQDFLPGFCSVRMGSPQHMQKCLVISLGTGPPLSVLTPDCRALPAPREFCLSEAIFSSQYLQGCAWCYLCT